MTPPWESIEILRIENGRVAERWSGDASIAGLIPLRQSRAALSRPGIGGLVPLWRVTWQPGANLSVPASPIRWLVYGDRGTLTIDAGSPGAEGVTLAPGEAFEMEGDRSFPIRNDSSLTARALLLAVWLPVFTAPVAGPIAAGVIQAMGPVPDGASGDVPEEHAMAPGVTARALTTVAMDGADDPLPIGAGTVVLAANGSLELPATGSLVIGDEAGAIDPRAETGDAHAIAGDGDGRSLADRAGLTTGACAITRGSVVLEQVGPEPAIVLILALGP